MKLLNRLCAIALTLPFISFANLSFAQEKSLEEVVITATYRETNAMDTPLSIDAIGEDAMEQLGAESLEDIFRSSAGLNLFTDGIGRSRIIIRGINSQDIAYPGAQMGATTGVYLDDVPITSGISGSYGSAGDTFDLNRVEVLKGPQGTLFGEASQGGTIRYIYNKPNTAEYEAKAKVKYATGDDSGDSTRVDALINIPFENGAVRLSAYSSTVGGFIDYKTATKDKEDWNEGDMSGGRFSVLFESDNLTTQFSSTFAKNEQDGYNWSYATPDAANPFLDNRSLILPYSAAESLYVGTAAPAADYFVYDTASGSSKNVGSNLKPGNEEEYNVNSLRFDLDTDNGTLTSITSMMERDVARRTPFNEERRFVLDIYVNGLTLNFGEGVFSADGWANCFIPCNDVAISGPQDATFSNVFAAPFPDGRSISNAVGIVTGESEQLTQEFRFAAEPTDDLFYVVGLFFKDSEENRDATFPQSYFTPARAALGGATVDSRGNPICSLNCGMKADFESPKSDIEDTSIYGELTYQMDENWALTAGVRFSDLSKTIVVGDSTDEFSENATTPKLNISWSDDDHLLYLNYSSGIKMGGSNGAPLWNKSRWIAQNAVAPGTHSEAKLAYADTVTQYDSDELTNLELGYKGTLADGKVDLTAAIYQQEIDDVAIHVSDSTLDPVGGVYIANAGEASSDGYELALSYNVSDNITLSAFVTDTDATLDSGFNGFGGGALVAAGNKMANAPEETSGFSIDASHELGNGLSGRFFANYSTVGDRFGDSANQYALEEYSVANLRYTVDSNAGWRAALFVNNATDEVYVTYVDDVSYGFGTLGRQYGRPMEMGVSLIWDFN